MKKSVTVNVPSGKESGILHFENSYFFLYKDFQISSWIRTGVDNDNTIRVPGEGGVSAKSPRAGDVYVTLKVGAPLVNIGALCIVILKWDGNTTFF